MKKAIAVVATVISMQAWAASPVYSWTVNGVPHFGNSPPVGVEPNVSYHQAQYPSGGPKRDKSLEQKVWESEERQREAELRHRGGANVTEKRARKYEQEIDRKNSSRGNSNSDIHQRLREANRTHR